jgi:hypothetical protein
MLPISEDIIDHVVLGSQFQNMWESDARMKALFLHMKTEVNRGNKWKWSGVSFLRLDPCRWLMKDLIYLERI